MRARIRQRLNTRVQRTAVRIRARIYKHKYNRRISYKTLCFALSLCVQNTEKKKHTHTQFSTLIQVRRFMRTYTHTHSDTHTVARAQNKNKTTTTTTNNNHNNSMQCAWFHIVVVFNDCRVALAAYLFLFKIFTFSAFTCREYACIVTLSLPLHHHHRRHHRCRRRGWSHCIWFDCCMFCLKWQ